MKKLFLGMTIILFVVTLFGCSNKEKLYILNWGDYIDTELVKEFEKEFNVKVVYKTVGSNEIMESTIKNKKSPYDIVIPSEYMIDKLRKQELIQEIDFSKLPNYENLTIFEDAENLIKTTEIANYFIPYVWGTVGILYNTSVPGLEEKIKADPYGVLFDENNPYKVGMYDSSRDAVAMALIALGYDCNSNNDNELAKAEELLKKSKFYAWGEDNLKSKVSQGNLDLAMVYSGDYFDELFNTEEAELEVNFDYYAPNNTNIWIDGMVIPKNARNTELAYKFINFILDINNNAQNTDAIGYPSMFKEVYQILVSDEYGYTDDEKYYPFPENSTRQLYKYVSDAHYAKLNEILERVKVD